MLVLLFFLHFVNKAIVDDSTTSHLITHEIEGQLVATILPFLFLLAPVIGINGWAARMLDNSCHYQHGAAKGDAQLSSHDQSASLELEAEVLPSSSNLSILG